MTASPAIWFVYRSHREGPLGKRVRRIAAPSVLTWFQGMIEEARISNTPASVADADLGGPVHGLAALFEVARKTSLHTPKTSAALAKLIQEHLHLEADAVHADAHTLRVFANDDEAELAYVFFDDDALSRSPRTLTYLLHDEPSLPDGDAEHAFAAPPVPAIGPAGVGEGTTYACLLTFHNRHSIPGRVVAIPGVRMPDLAAHLRAVTPTTDEAEGWPVELRLLRAMIDAGDTTIAPALRSAAAYPLGAVMQGRDHTQLGVGAPEAARLEFAAAAEGMAPGGEPAAVSTGARAALLAVQTPRPLGYQQWILFDDRWGAANLDLATSLIHYTDHADPFTPLRVTRPVSAPKTAPKPKAKNATTKAHTSTQKAATKDEQAWKAAVGDRDPASARGYNPTARFGEGGLITHAKFGVGVVTRAEGTKCQVLFRDGPRILIHGATA
jgi:hypothetical protein